MATHINTYGEDLALDLGATLIRKDKTIFNAAGRSGVSRIPATAPKPTEPTIAVESVAIENAILEKLDQLVSKINGDRTFAPVITVPEPVVKIQEKQRVVEWEFTFTHNPDGSIKSINAKAVK